MLSGTPLHEQYLYFVTPYLRQAEAKQYFSGLMRSSAIRIL